MNRSYKQYLKYHFVRNFNWQGYLVRLFDNPFGRWYLGSPKGKHIARITSTGVHYYTGDISKRNGLPVICTGFHSSNQGAIIARKLKNLTNILALLVFLPFFPKVLIPFVVFGMADTGFVFPGTATTDSSVGTVDWTNPNNIFADDGVRATQTLNANARGYYLVATNYGFSIPVDAIIDGIQFKVEKAANTLTVKDNAARIVKGGVIGSTDMSLTQAWPTDPDITRTYGSSTFKWGESWVYTDINASNFGAALSAKEDSGGSTANIFIDFFQMKVWYTLAPTTESITKSLEYAVLVTPSALTKSLKYTVEISVSAITKSLKYTVFATPSAITKELIYSVITFPSALTKSLKYSILIGDTITKSLEYAVKITPFVKGLVGYWRMEEDPAIHGTTIVDDSGEGNDGLLQTGDGATNKSVAGKFNRAIDFDGANDVIDLPSINLGNEFTIGLWVKPVSKFSIVTLLVNSTTGWNTDGLRFVINNWETTNGRIFAEIGNGVTGNHIETAEGAISWGVWQHLVLVIDRANGEGKIYKDGIDITTDNSTLTDFNVIAPLHIGRFPDSPFPFDGVIDDVRIYNRLLSAGEVLSLYQSRLKSLQYVIFPTFSVTKSLQYVVVSPVSVTKELKYTIAVTPTAITKSLKYTIEGSLSITKTLEYQIQVVKSITKTLVYSVSVALSALTLSLKYQVIFTPSTLQKTLKYLISTDTNIQKSLKYILIPIGVGLTRGQNKDTNISIGVRSHIQTGLNKDTNTGIGTRKM